MRRAPIAVAGVLCGLIVAATMVFSARAETVVLPTARVAGEAFDLVLRTTKVKQRRGFRTDGGSEWRMRATVTARRPDGGYSLRLDTTSLQFDSDRAMRQDSGLGKAVLDAAAAIARVPIFLRMTPAGSVDGLSNGDEVLAVMRNAVNDIRDRIARDGKLKVDAATLDLLFDPLTKPAYLQQNLLEPFILLYFMSGAEVEVGETYSIDDRIVFPLTGTPIRAKIRFAATQVDRAGQTVTFDMRRELDLGDFKAAIRDLLRKVARSSGKTLPPDNELPFDHFDLDMATRYVYSLKTGLPISMRFRKHFTAPGAEQIETKEFDVSAPD